MSGVTLLFGLLVLNLSVTESYASSVSDELWGILQTQHNLVILMRHSHPKIDSGDPLYWDKTGNCKNEKMISNKGKAFARKIGEIFINKNIKPLVISSPMCRTIETATLAFGEKYITDPFLREIASVDNKSYLSFLNKSKQLFINNRGIRPMVFVSHRPNVEALSFELISVTELIVARVDSDGEIEVIGILKL